MYESEVYIIMYIVTKYEYVYIVLAFLLPKVKGCLLTPAEKEKKEFISGLQGWR